MVPLRFYAEATKFDNLGDEDYGGRISVRQPLRGYAVLNAPRHTVLTIDLAAVAANWRALRDRSQPAECAGMIKADAYGLGLEQVGRALQAAGCRRFFRRSSR